MQNALQNKPQSESQNDRPALLGLFAKHWTPGQVKTRLASGIGNDRATDVYFGFVTTLLQRLGNLADRRWLCYWPPGKLEEFKSLPGQRPLVWSLELQHDGDLGERIEQFFAQAFAAGFQRVVLLGTDSPNVPIGHVAKAFELLNAHRLVLGPTEDGGYYLIGAYAKVPPILRDMPWSTADLWPTTLRRLDAEGWQRAVDYEMLPEWYDVDTVDDLKRLHRELLVESVGDEMLAPLCEQVGKALGHS